MENRPNWYSEVYWGVFVGRSLYHLYNSEDEKCAPLTRRPSNSTVSSVTISRRGLLNLGVDSLSFRWEDGRSFK